MMASVGRSGVSLIPAGEVTGWSGAPASAEVHVRQPDDLHAGCFEGVTGGTRDRHAGRFVAVHTERVDAFFEPFAVARNDDAVDHHVHDLFRRDLRIFDHGSRDLPRSQIAFVVVLAVAVAFARDLESQFPSRFLHLRAEVGHVDDVRVHRLDRAPDRHGVVAIFGRHVGKCAVRLHVRHLLADVGSHPAERADLVGDDVFEMLRVHVDAAAAETPEIVESGMRADADPLLFRALDDATHRDGISGVKTARDARRANDFQNGVVVADVIGAVSLAHVRVQVHRYRHDSPVRRMPEEVACPRLANARAMMAPAGPRMAELYGSKNGITISLTMAVRFLPSGDTALVVEFGERIDRALNERVLRLNAAVRAACVPGIVETVPTFRSLMVHYDPL